MEILAYNFRKLYHVYVVVILIGCLFCSPFIIPGYLMDSFLTGPRIWLYFVVIVFALISGICLIINGYKGVSYCRSVSFIDVLVITMLLAIMIRNYFLEEQIYFSDKLVTYICLTFIYFIFRFYFASLNVSQLQISTGGLIIIVSIITLTICIGGLLQLFEKISPYNIYFKVTGPFDNPAKYANYLITILPTCICTYFVYPRSLKLIYKHISLVMFLLALFVIFATNTRASWIGLSVSVLFILYFKYSRITVLKTTRTILTIVILFFTCTFFLYMMKPDSALGRVLIWKISSKIVSDNPITGIGYGKFETRYADYQAEYFSKNQASEQEIQLAGVVRYSYNIFLKILVEQGVIGLMLFIGLLVVIIRKYFFYRNANNELVRFIAIISISSLISIIVCGLFSYPFDILPVQIIFFIFLGMLQGLSSHVPAQTNRTWLINYTSSFLLISGFLGFSVAISLCCLATKEFNAYKNWKSLNNPTCEDLYELYKPLKEDIHYLEYFSMKLVDEGRYSEAISLMERSRYLCMYPSFYIVSATSYTALGQYQQAESAYRFASDMIPNLLLTKYRLVQFYYQTQQYEKAYKMTDIALKMKIKVPSAEAYSIKNDLQKMMADSKKKIIIQ